MENTLNINVNSARTALFNIMMYLNKDFDGDFITIDGVKYYANINTDYISICDKLPRIKKKDGTAYVTGDAQDWTYHYTWEDFMETFNDASSDERSERNVVFKKVREYFMENPKEALGGPDETITEEYVLQICKQSVI